MKYSHSFHSLEAEKGPMSFTFGHTHPGRNQVAPLGSDAFGCWFSNGHCLLPPDCNYYY